MYTVKYTRNFEIYILETGLTYNKARKMTKEYNESDSFYLYYFIKES